MRTIIGFALLLAFGSPATAGEPANNMKAITAALNTIGIKWEPAGRVLCEENICSALAGPTQIDTLGFRVDVMVSSREPLARYQRICAAALSGLTGTDLATASAYVVQGFSSAAVGADAKYQIGRTAFVVRSGSDSRLECSFVKR